MHDNIGDIAVYEQFPRQKPDNLVGGYAAVGTAYPQVGGGLLVRKLDKEFGVLPQNALSPCLVVLKEMIQRSHKRNVFGGQMREVRVLIQA
jgi:hypothetical protein